MRILHVITTLDVGGAEMHLLAQVAGQCARGHDVRVAYLKGEGRLTTDFEAAGAEAIVPVGSSLLTPFKLFAHLRWANLVHSHLLKADAVTAIAATLAMRRRRLISGKHNDEQVLRRPAVSMVHGVLGNLPRKTIVLSDHVGRFVEEFGRVSRAKQERIYYGLDPAPFEAARATILPQRAVRRVEFGFGEHDIVFICVARFAPQKAHDVLLRAFARAIAESPSDSPPLRLLLVGGDPFGDGVERAQALADELELGSSVIFCGIRRDVPELLALSDVFVMSSLWEGLGLVFLEAMATDLPVLATRVSAVPEVVVDGETGWLVEPSNEAQLARAMLGLAADSDLRERYAKAGRARVGLHFGIDRMVDETLAVYQRVIE